MPTSVKMPTSARNKSAMSQQKHSPKIEKHYNQRVSFMQKPQAHDILADKVLFVCLAKFNVWSCTCLVTKSIMAILYRTE